MREQPSGVGIRGGHKQPSIEPPYEFKEGIPTPLIHEYNLEFNVV
jgi:hypothetical protein